MAVYDIEETLIAIVRKQKKLPDLSLTRTTLLTDLGIDSLDSLTILFDIEEKFDISIPDDVARRITTVGDLVDIVSELVPTAS